jgi:hypothetical protein
VVSVTPAESKRHELINSVDRLLSERVEGAKSIPRWSRGELRKLPLSLLWEKAVPKRNKSGHNTLGV